MTRPSRTLFRFARMRRMKVIVIFVFLLSTCFAAEQEPIVVSNEDATAHLLKKVEPAMPPLAKKVGIGGTVVLFIVISPEGKVTSTTVVSGHPILIQAALDAVRQWTYKPFETEGKAVKAKAQVTFFFPGGRSKDEEEANQKYFKSVDECRSLLNAKKYEEGEAKCREAVTLSNTLPIDAVLERSNAQTFLGHTIYLQGRAAEAIPIYAEALRLNQNYLNDDDADLASDYANLGRAYARAGDLAKADSLYDKSVKTFKAAILGLPSMKENYTARLKRILKEYAQIKQAEGQNAEAEQLDKQADMLKL
jgi:TonB family protein